MDPLFKTALLRTLALLLFVTVSTLIFVGVENSEEDPVETKYKLLRSLYESMASKYNMTIEEFNNFSNGVYEALSEPKPQWNHIVSADFVFQAITTIGKATYTTTLTMQLIPIELNHSPRDSIRKARKSFLTDLAGTLKPHGLNRRDEL